MQRWSCWKPESPGMRVGHWLSALQLARLLAGERALAAFSLATTLLPGHQSRPGRRLVIHASPQATSNKHPDTGAETWLSACLQQSASGSAACCTKPNVNRRRGHVQDADGVEQRKQQTSPSRSSHRWHGVDSLQVMARVCQRPLARPFARLAACCSGRSLRAC
jgi:hypothetical protein